MQVMRKPPALPGRVRLRTLVYIRWVAVAGQLATLILVHFGLGYKVPIATCLAIVALSAAVNIVTTLRLPLGRTLRDRWATAYLAYDILQLCALLYLTGGLQNPFSILILASVTVSATVLSRRSTIALGLLAAVCITVLALAHEPFPWLDQAMVLPDLYIMGIWQALIIGILFISAYIGSVAEEARAFQSALAATQVALEREQHMSALGGLAAAAAHELGSPLSTIAVAAKEMAREVPDDSPLADDIALLIEQSDRCRDLLAELGRRPTAKGGDPFLRIPLGAMLEEAARGHLTDAVEVVHDVGPADDAPDSPEPMTDRSPEFLHGVGTLIQNAIQFATSRVMVRARWNADTVTVEILDDGPGISTHLLDRLGEPYVSSRAGGDNEGEHMGLGIFIAQNLLSHIGGELTFSNQDRWQDRGAGAAVRIVWPRGEIEARSVEKAHV